MKESQCKSCANVYPYYEPKGNSWVAGTACSYGIIGYPRKNNCKEYEPISEDTQDEPTTT